jgi:hypothetical protein
MMHNKVTENRKINHSNRNNDSVQDSYILKKIKNKMFYIMWNIRLFLQHTYLILFQSLDKHKHNSSSTEIVKQQRTYSHT